ncbi:MAG: alpha/beta hydrolase [Desulfobacterales bacterium]
MLRPVLLILISILTCSSCRNGPVDGGTPNKGPAGEASCVILLHGLGRTPMSMTSLAHALETRGYRVTNQAYPSTQAPIEILTRDYLAPAVQRCQAAGCRVLHMVSHSLGGILIRQYLQTQALPEGSRIVMLSPPNQGSQIADHLKSYRFYDWLTGPAGQQLGTESDSVPRQLAPVDAAIGVITGSESWNPFFSYLIPGPDDGKVAVDHARLAEMTDFVVVPAGHTFIMDDDEVIAQTLHFLQYGRFDHKRNEQDPDGSAGNPSSMP